jgi:hypothetical protein
MQITSKTPSTAFAANPKEPGARKTKEALRHSQSWMRMFKLFSKLMRFLYMMLCTIFEVYIMGGVMGFAGFETKRQACTIDFLAVGNDYKADHSLRIEKNRPYGLYDFLYSVLKKLNFSIYVISVAGFLLLALFLFTLVGSMLMKYVLLFIARILAMTSYLIIMRTFGLLFVLLIMRQLVIVCLVQLTWHPKNTQAQIEAS